MCLLFHWDNTTFVSYPCVLCFLFSKDTIILIYYTHQLCDSLQVTELVHSVRFNIFTIMTIFWSKLSHSCRKSEWSLFIIYLEKTTHVQFVFVKTGANTKSSYFTWSLLCIKRDHFGWVVRCFLFKDEVFFLLFFFLSSKQKIISNR